MKLLEKSKTILREDGIFQFIYSSIKFLFQRLAFIIARVYSRVLGRNEKIWIFSDFYSGQEFSQNKRYLFQYLTENYDNDVRSIWLTSSSDVFETLSNNGYEVYMANSWKARYYTLRAEYIPVDSGPGYLTWWCTGGATIIQMGHGIPLKSNGQSTGEDRVSRLLSWRSADHAVFSSLHCKKHFQEFVDSGCLNGFINVGLSRGDPIYSGYPRTDVLVNDNESNTSKININKEQLDIDMSKLVIGYFPTRREGNGLDLNNIFEVSKTEQFLQQNDATLLIKPHRQLEIGRGMVESDSIQLIDPDTDSHQFLKEIDVLITDYSSIYFDFLLLDRPVIFYTPDYSTYENIRGVHPNYESVIAGPRVDNFEGLLEALKSTANGSDEYRSQRKNIRDKFFEHKDGNACERIFNSINK